MEKLATFLMDKYIFIVIFVAFLVLAIIGYIIDTIKTNKLIKKYTTEDKQTEVPLKEFSQNVIIGENVNNMASKEIITSSPVEVANTGANDKSKPPIIAGDSVSE